MEWIEKVVANKEVLRALVRDYHPANLNPNKSSKVMDMAITAPNAERACEIVREQIRSESLDNPEIQFDIALAKQDISTIYSLLSSTWFGVPESTSCWSIDGFGMLVDLLDDPPDESSKDVTITEKDCLSCGYLMTENKCTNSRCGDFTE